MRKKGCVLNYWILAIAYLEVRHADIVRTRARTTVELPGKVKCHPLHRGCHLAAGSHLDHSPPVQRSQ